MTLDNLFKINQLKREAADEREVQGLIRAANDRLNDAENISLSYASRFDLAYNAAHGFALAALRAAVSSSLVLSNSISFILGILVSLTMLSKN